MLKGPFIGIINFKFFNLAFLVIVILTSALAVVFLQYQGRMLHAKFQRLELEREAVLSEWNKLLLEYGAFTTDTRVEKIVVTELGMRPIKKVELITP
jgi:cell division protein FtsL